MQAIGGWWCVMDQDHYNEIIAVFRDRLHASYFSQTWTSMTGHRAKLARCPAKAGLLIGKPALTQLAEAAVEK